MAGLAAAEGNARAPSRPAALYGRRAGQSARGARALSRLHALPHPWLERALDDRHAGLVRLHPHAQRGRDRSLRAREGRHQGGGDLNLVYSGRAGREVSPPARPLDQPIDPENGTTSAIEPDIGLSPRACWLEGGSTGLSSRRATPSNCAFCSMVSDLLRISPSTIGVLCRLMLLERR